MTTTTIAPPANLSLPSAMAGPPLAHEARDVMTPGVVTISEDASLIQAARAMREHRVHAVLVVGRRQGVPLGWVTARGMLGRLDCDAALVSVRDAVVERAVSIHPTASVSDAVSAMSREGVSRLLVAHPGSLPEGVVSELDLAMLVLR